MASLTLAIPSKGRLKDDCNAYFADAGAVLITGPGNAKAELIKHIHEHDPRLMKSIAGVETVDHPSDAQLVAYAKHYLTATDRLTPQKA